MPPGWKYLLITLSASGFFVLAAGEHQTVNAQPAPSSTVETGRVVPGSEVAATVVFLTRIINHGQVPLVSPRIHMHEPVRLPHQTISELEVEGKAERRTDRWGAPILVYQRGELTPQTTMTGRWTAWATIRRFQWNLRGTGNPEVPPLSAEDQALYQRDAEWFLVTEARNATFWV